MTEWLTDPSIWGALLTLTALEIVLGIDNVIFIALVVDFILLPSLLMIFDKQTHYSNKPNTKSQPSSTAELSTSTK